MFTNPSIARIRFIRPGAARVFAFSAVMMLAGCGQAAEDYRVIEREYVPASEIPGIDDIDLEQVSYPVVVGSVAIAEQFPAMAWPDMVREERFRLGLDPPAELLYPRECLFAAPARHGIGTVRRIIDGELVFFRIHRAAEGEHDQCRPDINGAQNSSCYRITALSESSRMCADSISVTRLASFDVIGNGRNTRILYMNKDAIFLRDLSIRRGCPVFNEDAVNVISIGKASRILRAHTSKDGIIHLAWGDASSIAKSNGLKYVQFFDTEDLDSIKTSPGRPSSPSFGFSGLLDESFLIWNSTRFYSEFLFKVENPNKLMALKLSSGNGEQGLPVVLNDPRDDSDNAFPPIVFAPAGAGIALFWRAEIGAISNERDVQSALMNLEMTRLRISDSPMPSRDFERRLLERMTEYHRQFGRGPDGPLDPLPPACFESRMERIGGRDAGVISPGSDPDRDY